MGKKNAKEYRRLKKLQKLERKKVSQSMTWISKPMGKSINEDDNRVVIGKTVKSKVFDMTQKDYTEQFIGGFKTLSNDEFFNSVVPNKQDLIRIENEIKGNEERCFHTQGDFSGIKHIAFWSNEYNCFLAWKHTPKGLNVMSA